MTRVHLEPLFCAFRISWAGLPLNAMPRFTTDSQMMKVKHATERAAHSAKVSIKLLQRATRWRRFFGLHVQPGSPHLQQWRCEDKLPRPKKLESPVVPHTLLSTSPASHAEATPTRMFGSC